MDLLKQTQEQHETAQETVQAAEIALLEATAAAAAAREAAARLKAAVAALSGESPSATAFEPPIDQNAETQTVPGEQSSERQATADMTPEEFDADRRKKRRKKEKEEQANNPYAHIKCSGCGLTGSMSEQIMQAPSGAPIRMMICSSCGNQSFT